MLAPLAPHVPSPAAAVAAAQPLLLPAFVSTLLLLQPWPAASRQRLVPQPFCSTAFLFHADFLFHSSTPHTAAPQLARDATMRILWRSAGKKGPMQSWEWQLQQLR